MTTENKKLQQYVFGRELHNVNLQTNLVPTKLQHTCEVYSKVYNCKYHKDKIFISTKKQDILVYDMELTELYEWIAESGNWTISDLCISNAGTHIAYSSLCPFVHHHKIMRKNGFFYGERDVLEFSRSDNFAIWSLQFSGDDRELVAGTSDASIYVFDIERNMVSYKIRGHTDDVNSVCFLDSSTNVLASGSDDTYIKIWDRRSRNFSGYFVGHTEGITHISSNNDSRYLISNGKDQKMKMWDLRKLKSSYDISRVNLDIRIRSWDYRWMKYPLEGKSHPDDCSVKTFKGHSVLKTLIKCYFSPVLRGGHQYCYTGSADGQVHIFGIHNDEKIVINTGNDVVRDLSWHDLDPLLVISNWRNKGGSLDLYRAF
jgi:WD repeat-containing protein 23